MTNTKIEKDIPIDFTLPTFLNDLKQLKKVGQSFTYPHAKDSNMRTAIQEFRKRAIYKDRKFRTKRVLGPDNQPTDQRRIWRVE